MVLIEFLSWLELFVFKVVLMNHLFSKVLFSLLSFNLLALFGLLLSSQFIPHFPSPECVELSLWEENIVYHFCNSIYYHEDSAEENKADHDICIIIASILAENIKEEDRGIEQERQESVYCPSAPVYYSLIGEDGRKSVEKKVPCCKSKQETNLPVFREVVCDKRSNYKGSK